MVSKIKFVPIVMPVLASEYVVGMANLETSRQCAGYETKELVVVDTKRVGVVRTFNKAFHLALENDWNEKAPAGLEYTFKYVCFLSADECYHQEGWLRRLVAVADSCPEYGFIVPSQVCGTAPQKHARPGMAPEVEVVNRAAFGGGLFRVGMLNQIGLMSEDYRHYGADYELQGIAREAGWLVAWVKDVWCEHDWQPDAFTEWVGADRALYYSRWNRDGGRR